MTAGFSVAAIFNDIPLLIPAMFGLVAIATAPAPVLSIINEYETDGSVTKTTLPLTVMNTTLSATIFFAVTSILQSAFSESEVPILLSLALKLVVPIGVGCLVGAILAKLTPHAMSSRLETLVFVGVLLLLTALFLFLDNAIYAEPTTNFIMAGAGFAAGFVNFTKDEKQEDMDDYLQDTIQLGLLFVIVSLSAPLDPSLLLSAGIWSLVYVALRVAGSWVGAFFGGKAIGVDKSVSKYIGLTLTPHAGIALVHTGVAAEALSVITPDYTMLLQTIIPAAAVLNEIFAILISKKVYDWSGELSGHGEEDDDYVGANTSYHREISASRVYQNRRHPRSQTAHFKKEPFNVKE